MRIAQIPVGNMQNFSYVVYDEKNNMGAIIDPSWDLQKILHILERNKISPKKIKNKHKQNDQIKKK